MGRSTTGFRGISSFGKAKPVNQPAASNNKTRVYDPDVNRGFRNSSSSSSSGIQSLDSNKGNNFISDLKKSSQFLYSQHPYAQELKKKYNLSDDDIINLRIGVNQPGHSKKIRDVYSGVLKGMNTNYVPPTNFQRNVMDGFEEGMKMSDLYKDPNSNYFANNIQSMPFLLGANSLFGSPRGQEGYYFAQKKYPEMSNDDYKNFAASIANNPDLYDQMMQDPIMKEYAVDQYAYDVQRTNPMRKDNGIMDIPAVEPAPYDFVSDNPFFN